ncbi:MAG TPA: TatD family hydrolase, partial [Thermodesulfovibrionales bacterium]|nr:TatD family hydrolase [Thermodesulfovibrionales bacterium]
MIDTHCHLDMFDEHDAVIRRARDAGITSIITIGSDFDSNTKNIAIALNNDPVYTSVGIHPHDAKDFSDETYAQIRDWTKEKKVVAIGETGLDYHYDHSPRDVQRDVFKKHLDLAHETGLP